jgi:hypothetical protein
MDESAPNRLAELIGNLPTYSRFVHGDNTKDLGIGHRREHERRSDIDVRARIQDATVAEMVSKCREQPLAITLVRVLLLPQDDRSIYHEWTIPTRPYRHIWAVKETRTRVSASEGTLAASAVTRQTVIQGRRQRRFASVR